jgi:hypothetical protein
MRRIVEFAWESLSKDGEELCGDSVRILTTESSFLVVLSDGLGSGVKANILSTLTSQIASTMFEQGATVEEVMATLADTLPECRVRHLAYATLAMLRVQDGREAYLVEYDTPPLILVRQGQVVDLPASEREFSGRRVREARFDLHEDDCLVMVSDGYDHAGVGRSLPLGWGRERIAGDVVRHTAGGTDAHGVASALKDACLTLYDGAPGDDATVLAMRIRPARAVTIWTGPPADHSLDADAVARLMSRSGTRVICGGTTAQIAARMLDKELVVDWVPPSKRPAGPARKQGSPPMAHLEGLDLVTEGIITLGQTLQLLESARTARELPDEDDASTRIARLLLESDDIHLIVGTALHPTQIADLVRREPMRHVYVRELLRELQRRNKNVTVEYI